MVNINIQNFQIYIFFYLLDDSEYLLVYNRPKQYYGSLYEPDKQYVKISKSSSFKHFIK